MNRATKRWALVLLAGAAALAATGRGQPPRAGGEWRAILADRVTVFGHRNWIAVVDSAYPAQARGGIETVITNANQLDVTKAVLDELGRVKHVRPVVYLDAELPHVGERDAPGITDIRKDLKALLSDRKPQSLPHEQLLDRLDKAGDRFQVLVLKTNSTLPYTSVFIELECGYWTPEAEKKLREAMGAKKEK
jgi:hypothetical protein